MRAADQHSDSCVLGSAWELWNIDGNGLRVAVSSDESQLYARGLVLRPGGLECELKRSRVLACGL